MDLSVFEKVNQISQRSFVCAEAVHGIEMAQTAAAKSAATFIIERPGVEKRSVTGDAEELGVEGSGNLQTGGTNRDARSLAKRNTAHAAVFRKNQAKHEIQGLLRAGPDQRSWRETAIREGSPPYELDRIIPKFP